jgi:hypothetical protein
MAPRGGQKARNQHLGAPSPDHRRAAPGVSGITSDITSGQTSDIPAMGMSLWRYVKRACCAGPAFRGIIGATREVTYGSWVGRRGYELALQHGAAAGGAERGEAFGSGERWAGACGRGPAWPAGRGGRRSEGPGRLDFTHGRRESVPRRADFNRVGCGDGYGGCEVDRGAGGGHGGRARTRGGPISTPCGAYGGVFEGGLDGPNRRIKW